MAVDMLILCVQRSRGLAAKSADSEIGEEGTIVAKYGHLPILGINMSSGQPLFGSYIHIANLEDERQRYTSLSKSANPAVLDL
jgi:hypothetical protein